MFELLHTKQDAHSKLLLETLQQIFLPAASVLAEMDEAARERAQAEANDMARHMAELLAYLLVPDRWLTMWFLWIGAGSNGKTLLTLLLQQLLPAEAVVVESLDHIANDKHGMGRLIGKSLVIDDDLKTGITIPDDFVKKISEGKPLSANVKFNPRNVSFHNR